MKKIGIIVGSLREGSFNKTVANYMSAQLSENYDVNFIDISALPFYNPDLDDDNTPQQWVDFRNIVSGTDAFLFVTPEYNRSVPAVLKNALDVASRPYPNNVWNNKPCGIVSVSTGQIGGFGANNHLRQTMMFLNMPVMQQPEAYLGEIEKALDESGQVNSDRTKSFLGKIATEFTKWVERF